jgi:hypothetical protein
MASQEDNKERQGLGAQQNPIEVEVIDLIRFHQPEDQSILSPLMGCMSSTKLQKSAEKLRLY